MKRLRYGLFLIIPICFWFTVQDIREIEGPHWGSVFLDPDYQYYMNGLSLSEFKAVNHIDHPGTPVQMITAATLLAHRLSSRMGEDEFRREALRNPEKYLNRAVNFIVFLYALVLCVAGALIFRFTELAEAGLFFQFSPFFYPPELFLYIQRLSCEPFLAVLGISVACLVICYAFRESVNSRTVSAWLGFIVGIGVATKLTFAAVVPIPLLIAKNLKERAQALGMTVAGFVIFTKPIWKRYGDLFSWAVRLATHKGLWGGGESGFIDPHDAFKFLNLLFSPSFIFIPLILSLGLGLLAKMKKSREKTAVLALWIASVVEIAMIAKHPHDHYLVPIFPLISLILAIVWSFAIKKKPSFRVWTFALAIMFVGWRISEIRYFFESPRIRVSQEREFASVVDRAYLEFPKCAYISFGNHSMFRALIFGNAWVFKRFSTYLSDLYPKLYYFAHYDGKLIDWNETSFDYHDLLKKYQCAVFFGGENIAPPYKADLKFKGQFYDLYISSRTKE